MPSTIARYSSISKKAVCKIRRSGGGRPALTQTDPTLLEDLRAMLESTTLGDPMRPLFWVSKSHAKLAQALRERGHRVSASRIPQWLDRLGYRRQVNRKSLEGGHHVDRLMMGGLAACRT
jgi:hypothetical protein